MNIKYINIMPILFILASCVQSDAISPDAKNIRSASSETKDQSCTYLNTITGFGYPFNGGYRGALLEIQDKTAKLGGNAYFIIDKSTEDKGNGTIYYHLTGEALLCNLEQK